MSQVKILRQSMLLPMSISRKYSQQRMMRWMQRLKSWLRQWLHSKNHQSLKSRKYTHVCSMASSMSTGSCIGIHPNISQRLPSSLEPSSRIDCSIECFRTLLWSSSLKPSGEMVRDKDLVSLSLGHSLKSFHNSPNSWKTSIKWEPISRHLNLKWWLTFQDFTMRWSLIKIIPRPQVRQGLKPKTKLRETHLKTIRSLLNLQIESMPRKEKCHQKETLASCRPTLQDSICSLTRRMKSSTQLKNRRMLLSRPRNKPKKDFKRVASKIKIKIQAANQTRKIKDLSSRPYHK